MNHSRVSHDQHGKTAKQRMFSVIRKKLLHMFTIRIISAVVINKIKAWDDVFQTLEVSDSH